MCVCMLESVCMHEILTMFVSLCHDIVSLIAFFDLHLFCLRRTKRFGPTGVGWRAEARLPKPTSI